MRSFWLCSYAFHITAWMSATLFHMRDLWLTERMDYFSACAAVTFSVTGCICMFFDFEHVKLIVVAWFVPYCIHIHYLATAPRFDYVRTSEINTFANVFVCLRVHVLVCMSVCDREEEAEGGAVCVCMSIYFLLSFSSSFLCDCNAAIHARNHISTAGLFNRCIDVNLPNPNPIRCSRVGI